MAQLVDECGGLVERGAALGRGGLGAGLRGLGVVAGVVGQGVERGPAVRGALLPGRLTTDTPVAYWALAM